MGVVLHKSQQFHHSTHTKFSYMPHCSVPGVCACGGSGEEDEEGGEGGKVMWGGGWGGGWEEDVTGMSIKYYACSAPPLSLSTYSTEGAALPCRLATSGCGGRGRTYDGRGRTYDGRGRTYDGRGRIHGGCGSNAVLNCTDLQIKWPLD